MLRKKWWWRDVAAGLLLAAIVIMFFWPVTLAGYWLPSGGGDLVSFLWPIYRFAAQSLREGVVPLWNPYVYAGAPFIADNQSGVFYPPNLIAFMLFGPPSYAVMEGLVLFHVWWAGLGCYVLIRRGVSAPGFRWDAVFGATAFMLSDVLLVHLGNLNLIAVSAWLPWLFIGLPVALAPPHQRPLNVRAAAALFSGVVLGVAVLAGHAQMSLYLALALGLYVLYQGVAAVLRREWAGVLHVIALTVLIGSVAAGLSAIAVLPAAEMVQWTGRSELTYEQAGQFSLNGPALTGLLSPQLFGRGPGEYWGPWDRVEMGYTGVLPVLLVTWLVLNTGKSLWRRSRAALSDIARALPLPAGFLVILLLASLFIALGPNTPVHRWVYDVVPGFQSVRAPARLLLLTDFAIALFAAAALRLWLVPAPASAPASAPGDVSDAAVGVGTGLNAPAPSWRLQPGLLGGVLGIGVVLTALLVWVYFTVDRTYPEINAMSRWPGVAGVVAGFALLWVIGAALLLARQRRWLRPTTFAAIALLILSADHLLSGSTVEIEWRDPTAGFDHAKIVEFLRKDQSLFRIEGDSHFWQPNTAAVHQLYDIGGISNPLELGHYSTYYWAVGEKGSPAYDLLGVKYLLWDKGYAPADRSFVLAFDGDPQVDVLVNTGALPRVMLFNSTLRVKDGDGAAALAALHAPGFDPAMTLILPESAPALPEPARPVSATSADAENGGSVTVRSFALNDMSFEVTTPAPAYLFLSEVYYPGWHAWVDGAPVPIWQADFAFRAMYVDAGQHTVTLHFEPDMWRTGVAVTALTVLLLSGYLLFSVGRRYIYAAVQLRPVAHS